MSGIILAIFIILLLCQPVTAAPVNNSVSVVMDNNYPPYIFLDNGGNARGILVDQWRLWEQKTGISVHISAMNWSEAQARMDTG